jgi:ligand-binding sensor domain-containing protein/uncharacterized membrane-anchored protein YhcB (DUF1043 family)
MKHRILWMFSILCSLGASAQKHLIRFENLTIEDGLAQSTITGIQQDQDGFMWFATAEGLHRFDGYQFKIYKNEKGNPATLPENYTTALVIDRKDRIWIGTNSGELAWLDKRTNVFTRIPLKEKSKLNIYPISTIYCDEKDRIWVGLDGGGIIIIDEKGNRIKKENLFPYFQITRITKTKYGTWVCTNNGLFEIDEKSLTILPHNDLEKLKGITVTDVFVDEQKRFQIATLGDGLFRWQQDLGPEKISIPKMRGSRHLQFILEDRKGVIWIGTMGGGLIRWENGKFYIYQNNPLVRESIIGDDVKSGFMDKRGNLWFGTISGISKFDRSIKHFELYREFLVNGVAINNNIYAIYEDRKQNIWIGTLTGGLLRFNRQADSFDRNYPILKNGEIETKAIRAIFEDREGRLWIGTRDEGIFSFNTQMGTFHQPKETSTLEKQRKTIRSIFQDSKGRLWLGTGTGVNLFDPITEEYRAFSGDSDMHMKNQVYQIIEDKPSGKLLVATFRGGLQLIDPEKGHFKIYRQTGDKRGPMSNNIMCIEYKGNGIYLLGTYGGGLNIFDINKDTFGFITENEGLNNNVVYGILHGEGEEYWLSTNRGLCRYDLKKRKGKSFGLENYLQSLEYNEGAYYKTHDGYLFFGGIRGINYFKPQVINFNTTGPKVVFTSFKILDKLASLEQDLNYTRQIEIPYNVSLIAFEFAALNYSDTKHNRYKYILEGFDKDWIESGTRRTAYYTRLSPGTYKLKVKACNNDGVWSETARSVNILVEPPFWMTTWFMILAALVLVALIIGFVSFRTRAVAKHYKHRQLELELQALRSQMNPHFIFNSLNSIQYFILQKDSKTAYTYLSKFSSLMRMILQNSRERYISLQAEKDWLDLYLELEKLRMENELEFEVSIADQLNADQTLVPAMMVQPYVENAVIHGLLPKEFNRILKVTFSQKGEYLHCTIEDNGIGREASGILNEKRNKKHASSGMKLTRERLEIITRNNKKKPHLEVIDLKNGDGTSAGTMVEIDIPLISKKPD